MIGTFSLSGFFAVVLSAQTQRFCIARIYHSEKADSQNKVGAVEKTRKDVFKQGEWLKSLVQGRNN